VNRYFRAVSSNLIFFVINILLFLIITPISIRVMGPEFFGLWSMLNALILLSGIGTLGISSIVNKFASEAQVDQDASRLHHGEVISAGVLIVLPMALITAALLALTRNFMAQNLNVSPAFRAQFGAALLMVAVGILPQFLARVPQGFLLSQLRNTLVRAIETVFSVTLWSGAVLIAYYRRDLTLIALWCLLNSTLMMLVYFLGLWRIAKPGLRVNFPLVRKMMNFSGYLFLESTAIAMFQQMDRLIVGLTLGPVIAGVYSVGTSVGLRLAILTGQVTEVMIPYASLKDSVSANERLYLVFRQLSRYVSLLVAGLGGLLVVWMNEILAAWISPAYAADYSSLFRLFIVAYGLLSLARPAHQTLTGIGQVRFTSLIYLFTTLIMLVSLFFLSRRFGFLGAALANFAPVLLLIFNLYTYRKLARRIAWRDVFSDLKWGLLLPVSTLLLVRLSPDLWMKTLLTTILGLLITLLIIKDGALRPWLSGRIRRLAPK
jgi:O-antigen/teichoic acid export membrane protein